MNSLPPDHVSVPHERQSEGFAPNPPPGGRTAEPPPDFTARPEFGTQLPVGQQRVDSRTPFRWLDLIYLLVFYSVAGGVIFFLVAAGALVFFGISPSELKNSTAAWASVLIVSQALLSGATLVFLYVMVRGRSEIGRATCRA